MNKFKKTLYIIIGLVLMTILAVVAGHYVGLANVPKELEDSISFLNLSPHTEKMFSPYFFWVSVAFFIIILVAIIVVLFYPRKYTEIKLEDSKNGKLKLKKSAVEGFVKTVVKEEGFMKSPVVTAKMYKKKFKVDVSGVVLPRINVVEKTQGLERDIKTGLDEFFGITKKVDYTVNVKNVEEKEYVVTNRVE